MTGDVDVKWKIYDDAVRLLHGLESGELAICDQTTPGDETRWEEADPAHADTQAFLKTLLAMLRVELARPPLMLHPPGMRGGEGHSPK